MRHLRVKDINYHSFLFLLSHLLRVVVFLAFGSTAVLAQDRPSLTAALNTTAFALDSTATLTITVNGTRSANIRMPQIEHLTFHRGGQNTQMQVINGVISSAITSTFIIQAQKAGKYTIPAIEVIIKGQVLLTKPISFEVLTTRPSSASPGKTTQQEDGQELAEFAFVRLAGLKKELYIGEIMPVIVKAYFKRGLRAEVHNLPIISGDGFVMSPPDGDARQTTETLNGMNYSVIAWQTTISPIKEGNYTLIVDLKATILFPQRNNRSRFNDPFFDDEFFSGFFGGYQRKTVSLLSPQQEINILPLPEKDKPDTFSGAIGEFDFEVGADPTDIEVGDPITFTMKISGKGNFDRVTAPAFPQSSDWKIYSPSSQFNGHGRNYEGSKVFEQAIVAKNSSVDAIPALTFSFFDPRKNTYVSKTSSPLPLTFQGEDMQQSPVQQQPAVAQPAIIPEQQQKNTRLSLAAIRLYPGNFTDEIQPIFSKIWYIAAVLCCSVVLLALFLISVRKRYLYKNSSILAKKRVDKQVAQQFKALQQTMDGDSRFLHGCREIIQTQMGLLWQVEPSAITLLDLQKRLPLQSPLIEIFAAAEQQAYGNVTISSDDMKKYCALLKKELEDLS